MLLSDKIDFRVGNKEEWRWLNRLHSSCIRPRRFVAVLEGDGDKMENQEQLEKKIETMIKENCIQMVFSNPKTKGVVSKVKVRPVLVKDELFFQVSRYIGTKVFHENMTQQEMKEETIRLLKLEFKQAQILTEQENITILGNKHGMYTITSKKQQTERKEGSLSHNRKKRYILEEGKHVPFLEDLGVMTKDGKIVKARYDKFKQINRFLEFIEDILPQLPKDRKLTIIDFGCGKSYLTFAMYYYLKELNGYDIRVIGLDLKEDVIETCSGLTKKYGYSDLTFLKGDIASYSEVSHVDMVVTLHACDTATDYALYKAVKWGARVILSVPCCQHEWNKQMKNEELASVLKYGIIKERMAALLTDAVRAEYLENCGYRTQLLEFIDMEHTPKNILIRGIYQGKSANNTVELEKVEAFFQVHPTLGRLLKTEE